MKLKNLFTITIVLAISAAASADSWTISNHYLRLDGTNPSGKTDNVGIMVSYDWLWTPNMTFAVEAIGSWDSDADLYGGGVNTKYHMDPWGACNLYAGLYADYLYVRSLPSSSSTHYDNSECGFIYGPLLGMKMPFSESAQLFFEYRYGWVDGNGLPKAIDEANWFILGFEFSF